MSATLNFGTNKLCSLEICSIAIQKANNDLGIHDATTRDYVDTKIEEMKAFILGNNVSAMYDTLSEIEVFLKDTKSMSDALFNQINEVATNLANEVAALNNSIENEKERAEEAEKELNDVKFDKNGGTISGEVSINNSLTVSNDAHFLSNMKVDGNISLSDIKIDGKLYFSDTWRMGVNRDGKRIIFEYLQDNVWKTAIPFIRKK